MPFSQKALGVSGLNITIKNLLMIGNLLGYFWLRQYLRNRKHVPCFYQVKHEWKFGRMRNAVGTRATGECFHSFFKFPQTFTSVSITG